MRTNCIISVWVCIMCLLSNWITVHSVIYCIVLHMSIDLLHVWESWGETPLQLIDTKLQNICKLCLNSPSCEEFHGEGRMESEYRLFLVVDLICILNLKVKHFRVCAQFWRLDLKKSKMAADTFKYHENCHVQMLSQLLLHQIPILLQGFRKYIVWPI